MPRISEDHGKPRKDLLTGMWHAPDDVRHQLLFKYLNTVENVMFFNLT